MSRFVSEKASKIVSAPWWLHSPNGEPIEYVKIKALNWGDRQSVFSSGAKLDTTNLNKKGRKGSASGADVDVQFDLGGMQLAVMIAGIVSWTIQDDEGRIPELTPANIRRLLPVDGDFIYRQIDQLSGGIRQEADPGEVENSFPALEEGTGGPTDN